MKECIINNVITYTEDKTWHRERTGAPWKNCLALYVFNSLKSTEAAQIFHRDESEGAIYLKIYRSSTSFKETVVAELNTHLKITDLIKIVTSYLGFEIGADNHYKKLASERVEMSNE